MQEMSTAEHFNTSTTVTITVLDGDDQYPQFLPCTAHYRKRSNPICTNPVYTANVTEEAEVSDFGDHINAMLCIYSVVHHQCKCYITPLMCERFDCDFC